MRLRSTRPLRALANRALGHATRSHQQSLDGAWHVLPHVTSSCHEFMSRVALGLVSVSASTRTRRPPTLILLHSSCRSRIQHPYKGPGKKPASRCSSHLATCHAQTTSTSQSKVLTKSRSLCVHTCTHASSASSSSCLPRLHIQNHEVAMKLVLEGFRHGSAQSPLL